MQPGLGVGEDGRVCSFDFAEIRRDQTGSGIRGVGLVDRDSLVDEVARREVHRRGIEAVFEVVRRGGGRKCPRRMGERAFQGLESRKDVHSGIGVCV